MRWNRKTCRSGASWWAPLAPSSSRCMHGKNVIYAWTRDAEERSAVRDCQWYISIPIQIYKSQISRGARSGRTCTGRLWWPRLELKGRRPCNKWHCMRLPDVLTSAKCLPLWVAVEYFGVSDIGGILPKWSQTVMEYSAHACAYKKNGVTDVCGPT